MTNKVRIQTTVDSEIYNNYIKKLLPKYGQLNRLIEEAVRVLYSAEVGEITDLERLRLKMMREVGMIAIGFESAEHAVSGDIQKVLTDNEINFLLEWYYGRPLDRISLEEAIEFLRLALLVMNWASDAKINHEGDETHILARSNVGKRLAELFCMAIKHFFETTYKKEVRYSIFSHGFTIIFKVV